MLIKCAPDRDGCVDLLAVLRVMNQIDQEQAWALGYQLAALMQRLWPAGAHCATIESLAQIHISREGFVHAKSLAIIPTAANDDGLDQSKPREAATNKQQQQQQQQQDLKLPRPEEGGDCNEAAAAGRRTRTSQQQKLPPTPPITPELRADGRPELGRRRRASSEAELVASLGIALFWALDYGIAEDEERKLGRAMEFLIVQSQKGLSLEELERICIERLPVATKAEAERHYRSVCKALIADTIELSLLLEKIYTATLAMNGRAPALDALKAAPTNNSDINSHHHHHHAHHHHHRLQQQPQKQQQKQDFLHYHHHHHQPASYLHHHLLSIDRDELDELSLPLASLRALKINDWARLWMQVIRELRQRRHFTHQRQQYENERAAELQTV